MAIVKKSVIGRITGKLDYTVFKEKKGKNVAYVWPEYYKASKSALAKEGRNNFAMTVKFAKAVNFILGLKEIFAYIAKGSANSLKTFHMVSFYFNKTCPSISRGGLTQEDHLLN